MKLELELAALVEVHSGMVECMNALETLKPSLESSAKSVTIWTGKGKDAFFRMNEQLKNRTEACGERVRDTVIALTNSLNKYYELENSTFESNKALDAGNIFKQEVRDVQQSFRFPASAAANREQA